MRAPLCCDDPGELFGRAAIEDPHPFFARLRAEHPVSRVGDSGVHLVATWAGIDEALQREDDFSANLTGVLVRAADGRPALFEFPSTGANDVIATADEPRHAVHRALVQPALSPDRIAALETRMRAWTRSALAPWLDAGGGDFAPVAELVPALAVAYLLGLPEHDVQRLRVWTMMGGDMLAGDASADRLAELGAETARMAAYLQKHLETALRGLGGGREANRPEAPLLHALASGVRSGALEMREATGIAIVMFGAGGESTAALIGSAVRLLAADLAMADALRTTPERIPRFVEEVVRLEPPFKFHYRAVSRPCRLAGFELDRGDRLMLVWASANRDPAVFEDPDALRLDRRHPKRHMGFGRGAHFCVGATLARLEARIVLEELLARTQRFGLRRDSPPVHATSIFVRRLERLAVEAAC